MVKRVKIAVKHGHIEENMGYVYREHNEINGLSYIKLHGDN